VCALRNTVELDSCYDKNLLITLWNKPTKFSEPRNLISRIGPHTAGTDTRDSTRRTKFYRKREENRKT